MYSLPADTRPRHQRFPSSSTVASTLDAHSRPLPHAFLDDPAFSSDPDENPLFSMSSFGDFLPANPAALDVHASLQDNHYRTQPAPARMQPSHHPKAHSTAYHPPFPEPAYPSHPRTRSHGSALPPPRAPPSTDTWAFRPFDDPLDDFPSSDHALQEAAANAYHNSRPVARTRPDQISHSHYQPTVSPTSSASSSPRSPPMSLELDSVPSTFSHSTYSQSSFSQSAYSLSSQSHSGHSHSAHSHSSHSDSSHASLASRSSTKKAPLPDPIILLPPPAYSVEPPPTDRPIIVTTESAPEIRHVSSTAVPPRPTSVPTPVAPQPPDPVARPSELRKQRSRRQSIVPPPGGLDKIDELDETDPLGFAWHHDSRYEGVKKVVDGADSKESKDSAKALLEKAERKKAKKAAGADPNAPSFSVKPGQIFPAFNPYHPQPTINPVSQGMAPGAPSQPQLGSATPQDLSYHVQRPALRSHSQSQPADPSQFLAQRLSSGAYLQPQPPQQSHSPAPPSDFAHHTLRQPSSASLHVHVQPQSPARQTSTHSLPELGTPRSQYEQLQPPQRPPSVHSQSSSELPYAQTLPNPHPLNRAQTPPRHRLSRMAQDMVAGSAPPPMGTPGFANDPAYNAFPQTPAPSSQTAQYGVPAGAPPAQPYRSSSGSSSRNRPPAPGLPPRLQQQQQMHAPPRPDIVLPPRHQAAKNRASVQAQGPPQPHYLPKRLVMPTPLQPMQGPQALPQQQSQMQGMLSYGSQSGSGSGPAGDMMPVGLGADYLGAPTSGQVQQQQQQQQQHKKAKEIPVSHGRNLLRKRATVNGASPTNAAAAAPDSSHQYHPHHHSLVGGGSSSRDAAVGMVNGVHVVGNGSGMGYVPSSNASAAMFAAKADAPLRPAPSSRSQSQGAVDARAEWESKMREKELQKEREREWKREMALESQMQKEREREAQKEKGGRKLSKRR